MKRLLLVVDYQKDFVDGALGFPGAEALDGPIAAKIAACRAAGDDVAFFSNNWIICHRVDFDFNFFFYISNRILASSMDLRDTTECVRVLDPLLGCNGCVFASFNEVADVASSCQLSTLRTDGMKVFFKWTGNPIVDFH